MAVTTNSTKHAEKVLSLQQKKEAKLKRKAAKSSKNVKTSNSLMSKSDDEDINRDQQGQKIQKQQDEEVADDSDEENEESNDEESESDDEINDNLDYWTEMTLTNAPTKKYKLSHINLDTDIELNQSMIQLKSDAQIESIPSKSYGIVTGDEIKGRLRILTVQFLKKERHINHFQAFLATEVNL